MNLEETKSWLFGCSLLAAAAQLDPGEDLHPRAEEASSHQPLGWNKPISARLPCPLKVSEDAFRQQE